MANAPQFKVYTADNEYIAACKHPGDAAAILALHGEGASIRRGHAKRDTLWVEGEDGWAGESFDEVAEQCFAVIEVLEHGKQKALDDIAGRAQFDV